MKKFYYLMALVAMTGFVFTSCNSDDDDSVNVTLTDPATKDIAAKYTFEDVSQCYQTEIEGVNVALTEIEITEANGAILKYEEPDTKAAQALKSFYRWHQITKGSDDRILILGFGEFIVEAGQEQEGGYHKRSHITLIPENVDPIDLYAALADPTAEGPLADFLCRTWTITKSRIMVNDYSYTSNNTRHRKQFATTWFSEADGTVHLQDLIDYANENHNAGITTDLGERNVIESVVFSVAGTFMINYKGTDLRDVGEWSWVNQDTKAKKGSIWYVWNDEEMGNDWLGGVATVSFSGNECDLYLSGKDESGVGSGTGHNSENVESRFDVQLKMQPAE